MTTAILLESPEPISFVHDVALTLTHRVRRFIPPPIVRPEPGGLAQALRPPARVPATVRLPTGRPFPPEPEPGTWIEVDAVVVATLISNGAETATLIIPASPLAAGSYTLAFALERTRWDTTAADPQATYQDAATIPLAW